MSDLLLITPPFTQLNTPYPATAYLKGFLNAKNISSHQLDLGIEVLLNIFNKTSLRKIFESTRAKPSSDNAVRIQQLSDKYINTIDHVIHFLQGKRPTLARQICSLSYLPQADRFHQMDDLEWAFGNMGMQDKAKYLATLYLEDISDFIVECVDEHFGFSRYAERLGRSANSFDALHNSLEQPLSFVDKITYETLQIQLDNTQPKLVCFSVPFPGNLYSAFRCAQYIKEHHPSIKVAMGGGFPNTELRSITDRRVFSFFDYICLDDGELPIELLYNSFNGKERYPDLKRTFHLKDDAVFYNNESKRNDYKQAEIGTPDYSDLRLNEYISVIEIANPMHSLWTDGRWNKLTMAHGCYWGHCTFCDISLDYIKLYEPIAARTLVDRMEKIIEQNGETGFHFVDEAAPPALMREVALEILKRKLTVTWWTNIRFEKSFTKDLCTLLQASGCVAVSGGLEVASDRLLSLIKKGVTVEQVALVTQNLTEAGIMVHAYLMYGYPTQTIQETIDSLEMVRQLFEMDLIQSGFWHQFALTAHSPIGLEPEKYGIIPKIPEVTFANNDLEFIDNTGINHDLFSRGLKKSLFNFMHGIGFELSLQSWFEFDIPESTIPINFIENIVNNQRSTKILPTSKVVWLGSSPILTSTKETDQAQLEFESNTETIVLHLRHDKAMWLINWLDKISVSNSTNTKLSNLKEDYEKYFEDFENFWNEDEFMDLRNSGLISL